MQERYETDVHEMLQVLIGCNMVVRRRCLELRLNKRDSS